MEEWKCYQKLKNHSEEIIKKKKLENSDFLNNHIWKNCLLINLLGILLLI